MDSSKDKKAFSNAQKGMVSGAATGAIAGASVGKHMGLAAPHLVRFIGKQGSINAGIPIAIVGLVIGGLLGDKIGGQLDKESEKVVNTTSTMHWNPK